MGIQITSGAAAQPAVIYDKVHVTNLIVQQPIYTNDADQPQYRIEVHYRIYGVADGVRYYTADPVQIIVLEDFLTKAMSEAAGGDMTLLDALGGIESAVAAILNDQGISSQRV